MSVVTATVRGLSGVAGSEASLIDQTGEQKPCIFGRKLNCLTPAGNPKPLSQENSIMTETPGDQEMLGRLRICEWWCRRMWKHGFDGVELMLEVLKLLLE